VEPDDVLLGAALVDWAARERNRLAERQVRVEVDGPHDPEGMDPVYILRLRSSGNEAEATLFRGGMLLLGIYDDDAVEVRHSHVDASTPEDVTAALDALVTSV
jgi:hypothetical protein